MKIGIMGPQDSIDKILSIQDELEDDITLIPFITHTLKESQEMIDKCQEEVDGVLFTGCSVYDSVFQTNKLYRPNRFVPHNETSIFSFLLNDSDDKITSVSIDVLEENIVRDSLAESRIKNYSVLPHNPGFKEINYIEFHEKNILEGRAEAILTTFSPIYDYFQKKGYPVYRLYTTRFSIRNTISHLINEIKNKTIDSSKISVQVINIDCEDRRSTKFDTLHSILEFEKRMIPYLKLIQGAIFNNGWNEFIIFSTKGSIISREAKEEFHKIINKTQFKVYSGVGIGSTAAEAEMNALSALKFSRNKNESCFYFMHEDKRVEGPINNLGCITLKNKSVSKDLQKISEDTGLSMNYIEKILSIVKLYGLKEFSADEMAGYLGITGRSSRRILKKLIDGGYAEVVGKENKPGSGRPQNIIRINI